MTTIKSVYSKLAEYTRTLEISDHAGGKNLVVHAGPTKLGVTVPTADLATALGLVTREELDRKQAAWENECGNLEMTQRERDALRAELDEAKATIARVREATAIWGDRFRPAVLAALDPKPALNRVILTADMAGVKVNGYDFAKGVLVTLPAEDADRLIGAGLAKDADQ